MHQNEAALAKHVVEFLEARGWDVYQEVKPRTYGGTADIVARQGPVIWVIECKMQCSFDVMQQAEAWKRDAHLVSVAVPQAGKRDAIAYKATVLKRLDLGLIMVRSDKDYMKYWSRASTKFDPSAMDAIRTIEVVPPVFNRTKTSLDWDSILTPDLKNYCEAGTAGSGGRLTPFRRTVEAMIKIVQAHPGITFKELFKTLKHHYSKDSVAKACIIDLVRRRVIREIVLDSSQPDKQYHLYIREEQEPEHTDPK